MSADVKKIQKLLPRIHKYLPSAVRRELAAKMVKQVKKNARH